MSGPPQGHEQLEYFTCTESKIVPRLDVAGAILNAVGAAITIADDGTANRGVVAAIDVGFVVLLAASSKTGYRRINECQAAKLELARRSEQTAASLALAADLVRWPPPPVADSGRVRQVPR